MATALDRIIDWAGDLPDWQSDIVHRLLVKESLTESDHQEAMAMLKAQHGLEDPENTAPKPRPLTAGAVSGSIPTADDTILKRLTVKSSVNAIPNDSYLEFGHKGITVVYGKNGSGKSGYARVLKRACNSRDPEEKIHPNVFTDADHPPASAILSLTIDSEVDEEIAWMDGVESPEILSSISVFDAKSARVIVDDNNEVVYLPYGTHVFNDLGTILTEIKLTLEQERPSPNLPQATNVPEGTAAGRFLAALSKDTTVKDLETATNWTEEDDQELVAVQRSLIEAQSNDPMKIAMQLRATAESMKVFRATIEALDSNLGSGIEEQIKTVVAELKVAREALKVVGRDSFDSEPLDGVGTEIWQSMYEAAREYSIHHAYPETEFPNIEGKSRCVLCQQPLEKEAIERFTRFKEYMEKSAKKAEVKAIQALNDYTKQINGQLLPLPEAVEPLLISIQDKDAELAETVRAFLASMENRKSDLLGFVDDDTSTIRPQLTDAPPALIDGIVVKFIQQADEVEKTAKPEEQDKLELKKTELEAKKNLAARKDDLKDFIKQAIIAARYDACLEETDTRSISIQGKRIISESLTPQLGSHLDSELKSMKVAHINLSLKPTSIRGETRHQLELEGSHLAEKVRLSEILSEGEHCVVAIAGFLSELDISGHKCPIVFDDPVCSLDHQYRQWIAQRIIRESTKRQVIVFTHDIAFLMELQDHADRLGDTPFLALTVHKRGDSPGYCETGLPWHSMKVKERIKSLKRRLDVLKDLHKDDVALYNERAGALYGWLRETWEATIEEKVLNEVIRRHGCDVQTMRLRGVEVTNELYRAIHEGMDKCSTWMIGHDKSKDLSEDRPPPDDVLSDIEALHTFIKEIDGNRSDLYRERESAVTAPTPEEIG